MVCLSEMFASTDESTQCQILEYHHRYPQCCEILKTHNTSNVNFNKEVTVMQKVGLRSQSVSFNHLPQMSHLYKNQRNYPQNLPVSV
jgi:uncharacterized protein with PQ loop repeat